MDFHRDPSFMEDDSFIDKKSGHVELEQKTIMKTYYLGI